MVINYASKFFFFFLHLMIQSCLINKRQDHKGPTDSESAENLVQSRFTHWWEKCWWHREGLGEWPDRSERRDLPPNLGASCPEYIKATEAHFLSKFGPQKHQQIKHACFACNAYMDRAFLLMKFSSIKRAIKEWILLLDLSNDTLKST